MNNALMPVGSGATGDEMTLTEALAELASYGGVGLFHSNDYSLKGWRCNCELVTKALGASFEVKSEWRHKTPLSAAAECVMRCRAAIAAAGALR